ncbi:hypothetical protein [Thetidibacter halocola]|uniref:Uncharacterized protein n=1 Tax=Thetidibacter halocola TaxID=2827239 RepID=A0A8J7WB89_9RHOB|nr:hypothetical protein [Thetidibacter halocola]MBS0124342.1 hypothetical protein [Thetidibacter halocola]
MNLGWRQFDRLVLGSVDALAALADPGQITVAGHGPASALARYLVHDLAIHYPGLRNILNLVKINGPDAEAGSEENLPGGSTPANIAGVEPPTTSTARTSLRASAVATWATRSPSVRSTSARTAPLDRIAAVALPTR